MSCCNRFCLEMAVQFEERKYFAEISNVGHLLWFPGNCKKRQNCNVENAKNGSECNILSPVVTFSKFIDNNIHFFKIYEN